MKKRVEVRKIAQQLGVTLNIIEEIKLPLVGEFGFCQRFGVGVISEISGDGWWYYFEGGDVAVNQPAVRKATESEINKWRNKQCLDL